MNDNFRNKQIFAIFELPKTIRHDCLKTWTHATLSLNLWLKLAFQQQTNRNAPTN